MIKLIGFTTMLIDHIGLIYFSDIIFFRILGRLSFPIFAWSIARGYKKTGNFNIYSTRILILAIISQVPYTFLFNNGYLNICFTLFAGLLALRIYDCKLSKWINWLGIIIILALSQYLKFEYGAYGVLMIFLFYKFWDNDNVIYYQAALTLASTLLFRYEPMQLIAAFSTLLILIVNRFDFKINKYFQYSFYPIHILILFLIKNGGFIS